MAWKRVELTEEDMEWFRKHIDPHIFNLIIKLNKLPFIETTWSCGGHITLTGAHHHLYHMGILFLVDKDSNNGERFIKELRDFVKNYTFVHLELPFPPPTILSPHPEYHLEVDWLYFPELEGKSKEETERILWDKFNEIYIKFNTEFEIFVDKWLSTTRIKN